MRLALFWPKIYLKVITHLKNISSLWQKKIEINRPSPIEVKNVILKLNTSKATGYDRILPKLVKDSAQIIAESLTVIFNKSIETGIFPDD